MADTLSRSKSGRREYVLQESLNGGIEYHDKHLADARRIQNVIFGSVREGDPDYGVNIASFVMEVSEVARDELEERISKAIAKYCPDVRVDAMKVEVVQAGSGNYAGQILIGIGLNYQGLQFPFVLIGEPHPDGILVSTLRV